jgi:hypothetical protein
MASSKLIIEHRPLFLNKYEYRAAIRLLGAGFCHHVDTIGQYQDKLDRIKSFWSPRQHLHSLIYDNPSERTNKNFLNDIDFDLIDLYLRWRKDHKHIFSFRQALDKVSIFGNDLKKLETIKDIFPKAKLTHARVLEPDTLYFKKNPKFIYRTYIKPKLASDDFYSTMQKFIDNNKNNDSYGFSSALVRRFSRYSMYRRMLHCSYYIDYNEPSVEMYLHILFPNMLGKKYNCKKHPDK